MLTNNCSISVLNADIDDENRRFKEALLFGIFGVVFTLQNICFCLTSIGYAVWYYSGPSTQKYVKIGGLTYVASILNIEKEKNIKNIFLFSMILK